MSQNVDFNSSNLNGLDRGAGYDGRGEEIIVARFKIIRAWTRVSAVWATQPDLADVVQEDVARFGCDLDV